ncbi:hemerythrin domain-containing protein [Psychrobacter jeotgali]|uniref:hemerythrin domain-containing protein n=1 Tax=Psychrobacter jeotgali TaxID=179010 RepID=UPI00191B7B7D|nr:hemerythrin domain-containing protein [Psychrobacter jeotgali]
MDTFDTKNATHNKDNQNTSNEKLAKISPRHPDSRLQLDWLFLYEKLPASHWRNAEYVNRTANWLNTHNGIRKRQKVLKQLSAEYQMGALNWSNYRLQVLPRIEEHVFKLHQHHSIEDKRYFPRFIQEYPQLKAGFELLERDHERLDALLNELQTLNNTLAMSTVEDNALAERLHHTLIASSDLLASHLSDEEDLVIPILGLRQD